MSQGNNPYDSFLGQYGGAGGTGGGAAQQQANQPQGQYHQPPSASLAAAVQQQQQQQQQAEHAAALENAQFMQILQATGLGAASHHQAQAAGMYGHQQQAPYAYAYQQQQHPGGMAGYNHTNLQQMIQQEEAAVLALQRRQQEQQQQQQQEAAAEGAWAAGLGHLLQQNPTVAAAVVGLDVNAADVSVVADAPVPAVAATAAAPAVKSPPTVVEESTTDREGTEVQHPPSTVPPEYYAKFTDLGLPEDKFWLSELQCYLRSDFCEVFGATRQDLQLHASSGRNRPLVLGQVGVRCKYCRDVPHGSRGAQSVSYPSQITGIYNSVQQMLRLHVDSCQCIPDEVKRMLESLKDSSSSRGGRKQYWIDSAKWLGLVDTEHGIHFSRDPTKPPPSVDVGESSTESWGSKKNKTDKKAASDDGESAYDKADREAISAVEEKEEEEGGEEGALYPSKGKYLSPDSGWERAVLEEKKHSYPLVLEDDSPLISDYLYLTMRQMEPCILMEPDQVGCYKGRPVGFRGLACRHCIGQAGSGRYFPASEASLSQTTTSQTILNHALNCRMVPASIREELREMKKSKIGEKGKKIGKPKHGGRKIFFHRLWCRIQGIPIRENVDSAAMTTSRTPREPRKKAKAKNINYVYSSDDGSSLDSGVDNNGSDYEDDISDYAAATGDDGASLGSDEGDSSGDEVTLCYSCIDPAEANDTGFCWKGAAGFRLAKIDDPLFLSERQCFMRGDLLEVFSSQEETDEVQLGQVGVRCVFCADAAPEHRSEEYDYFPLSLSTFYATVTRFHHHHLKICPNIPEAVKATFMSLKNIESGDENRAKEFWVDSARELGISDHPRIMGYLRPCLRFHRNPSLPSPADDLASGRLDGSKKDQVSLLIHPEDKGMVTDVAALLLRQFKRCRFKSSDRRGGSGVRNRDRPLGFAGLACIHCTESGDTIGRYFPLTAKHLADSTGKAIM